MATKLIRGISLKQQPGFINLRCRTLPSLRHFSLARPCMQSQYKDNKRYPYSTENQTIVCEVEKKESVYLMHLVNADNRLRPDTMTTLYNCLNEIETDFMTARKEAEAKGETPPVASLVTMGAGHIYSNGFEFSDLIAKDFDSENFFENYYHKLCLRMLNMPMPTIAAINGHAFGAGLMFAFTHDYKLMRGDRGYLCMPEVDLPSAMSPGMMSLVRSSTPNHQTFRDVILQGNRYKGDHALSQGIIDQVVPTADALLPAALKLANQWAPKVTKSPEIYKQLRLELKSDTVHALKSGGIGYLRRS